MPIPRLRTTALAALLALPAAVGCASSQDAGADRIGTPLESEGGEAVPYVKPRDDRQKGYVLAELGRNIDIWANLALRGNPNKDVRRLNQIESAIRYQAATHAAMLEDELGTGPVRNRSIAATALGFSESVRSLGPLFAALEDPEAIVVANALLGLSILADPDTPLTRIAGLLSDRSADASVRNNAGEVLRAMPTSRLLGEESDAVRRAARFALGDAEPQVRIHGALLLARMEDVESFDEIASLLEDEVPLVRSAASRAVAYLGAEKGEVMGRATRALVVAMRDADSSTFESAVLRDLQALTKRNYGSDIDEWLDFANQLN